MTKVVSHVASVSDDNAGKLHCTFDVSLCLLSIVLNTVQHFRIVNCRVICAKVKYA